MQNETNKILNELEQGTEMGVVQRKKILDSIDGLEPALEGVLVKTHEANEKLEQIVENTKKEEVQKVQIIGAELLTIKGEKGDKGDTPTNEELTELIKPLIPEVKDGKTPTPSELIDLIIPLIPEPEKGEDGKDYILTEKDKEEIVSKIEVPVVEKVIEKTEVIKEVAKKDTPKEIVDKIDTLKETIDFNKLKNKPDIKQLEEKIQTMFNHQSSKTVSLVELDDVNLDGLTKTNGKYDLGSGGGGITEVVAGTNVSVDNTDPTKPIVSSLSDRYKTTSTTSQTIVSTGSLTFTVDAGLAYIPQQDVIIVYDSSNHMHGTITSYSGTTLVVDITHKSGSGTYSSWVINLDGTPVVAGTTWGTITGTLSAQTDLQTALNGKWSLTGNAGTNPATDGLGTTDNQDLIFRTNNIERFKLRGGDGKVTITTGSTFDINGLTSLNLATFGVLEGSGTSLIIKPGTGGWIRLHTGGFERVSITSGGNVLVGTTIDSGYKLDVSGLFRVNNGSNGIRIENQAQIWAGGSGTNYYNASCGIIFNRDNLGITSIKGQSIMFEGTPQFTVSPYNTFAVNETYNTSDKIFESGITSGGINLFSINHAGVYGNNRLIINNTRASDLGKTLQVTGAAYVSGNVLIGTTIDAGYKLDVNGIGRFGTTGILASPNSTSVFYGSTPNVSYAATSNTIIGVGAGTSLTTSGMRDNVFIGAYAGQNAKGDSVFNVAIGSNAGKNTEGRENTFIGFNVGSANVSGAGNTAIGSGALASNVSGLYNTAVGQNALLYSTGNFGTAFGQGAGSGNTTGGDNAFFGVLAGNANTTGGENTYLGSRVGQSNATGNSNTFVGYNATYRSTVNNKSRNTIIGNRAGNGIEGDDNIAIGYRSMVTAGHTGIGNVVIGQNLDAPSLTGSYQTNINATYLGNSSSAWIGTGRTFGVGGIINIKADGSLKPVSLADSSASNDSIYYSTTAGKLVYKDSSGTVNNLY